MKMFLKLEVIEAKACFAVKNKWGMLGNVHLCCNYVA